MENLPKPSRQHRTKGGSAAGSIAERLGCLGCLGRATHRQIPACSCETGRKKRWDEKVTIHGCWLRASSVGLQPLVATANGFGLVPDSALIDGRPARDATALCAYHSTTQQPRMARQHPGTSMYTLTGSLSSTTTQTLGFFLGAAPPVKMLAPPFYDLTFGWAATYPANVSRHPSRSSWAASDVMGGWGREDPLVDPEVTISYLSFLAQPRI